MPNFILFIPKIIDYSLIQLNEFEIKLNNSNNNYLRKYGSYVVDLLSLIIFSYFLAALLFMVISLLPPIYMLISNVIKIIIGSINLKVVQLDINPLMFSTIKYKNLFILLILVVVISITILIFNYRNKDFRLIQLLAIANSILRLVFLNLQFKFSLFFGGAIFSVIASSITLLIVPISFFLNNILGIMLFWVAFFVTLFTYSNFSKDNIRAKRFVLFLLFVPISISYIIKNQSTLFDNPVNLLFLFVTIFLLFDRIFSLLVEYKEQIYEGKDLGFVITYFSEEDFSKIRIVNHLDDEERLELFDNDVLAGAVFLRSKNPDLLKAEKCLRKSLASIPNDNFVRFVLAEALYKMGGDKNLLEAIDLLRDIQKTQVENPYEFEIINIKQLINLYIQGLKEPNRKKIIETLENESRKLTANASKKQNKSKKNKFFGYRSNKKWKKFFASIIYIWLLLMILRFILPTSTFYGLMNVGSGGALFSAFTLIVGLIEPSFVLLKGNKTRKYVIYYYSFLTIAFFSLSVFFATK
ncbi:tetratricopeptide repeat protein [Priestia megaterium]|uniref:tetratricopeptide repeat protein n=1 Tax=Priestia megaterium TaxID=1404 RepID=UPI003D02C5BE